ncbi:MAG: neutral/alkaline non-lysosomal ceramidase N-terminal domain-containing protein [Bacteriovoracaceae bacterium]
MTLLSAQLSSASLEVGFASHEIIPGKETPLGGYGTEKRRVIPFSWSNIKPNFRYFKNNKGMLDQIRVKAMVLKKNNVKLLFLSFDLVGMPAEFYLALSPKLIPLGFDPNLMYLSATHTHSGPGSLSKNFFWQVFAMDNFNKEFYQEVVQVVLETVIQADTDLVEADLFHTTYNTQGLQSNRRGSDRPLDPRVNLLMAKSKSGSWLGGLVNFAVHGVSLDDDNLLFSSDTPGAIERESEKFLREQGSVDPLILFQNGAEGDVHPTHFGVEGIQKMGESFATQMKDAWSQLALIEDSFKAKYFDVDLGAPLSHLSNCARFSWLPDGMKIKLKKYFPSKSRIWQLQLGPLLFMTWPGEATTELGLRLKNSTNQIPWILGLTNDHLAYFTTPEEFNVGGYETCINFYGPDGGMKILKAHQSMINNSKIKF